MFVFNFPEFIAKKNAPLEQLRYVHGEVSEAYAEVIYGDRKKALEEHMDAIHTLETSLRQLGYTQEELDEAHDRVIEKNKRRGYYVAHLET